MVTIKDVAKLAGVSQGTVSNVLNENKSVTVEMINKVEKAIKELGYQPNQKARSIRAKKPMSIGVVLPNLSDKFYTELLVGIEKVLSEKLYSVSLYITSEFPTIENQILRQIQQQRMDGIIISTCQPENHEIFDELFQAGIRFVFVNRSVTGKDYNFVGFNNYKTIYDTVSELLESDCRKIALFTGPGAYSCERQCVDGYTTAFAKYGLTTGDYIIDATSLNKENAFKAGIKLLKSGNIPEVIITSSIEIADGILAAFALMDNEIKRPRMISLVEDSWTGNFFPQVIKIFRECVLLGKTASEILVENLGDPAFYEPRIIMLENIHRDLPENRKRVAIKKDELLNVLMLDCSASQATSYLLSDFIKREGVSVKIDVLNIQDLYEKITQEAEKSDYDLFQVEFHWLTEFAERGYLADLTGRIEFDHEAIDGLIPDILENFAKYNGRFYLMPYTYGTQLLFYRKDLFENFRIQRLFFDEYKVELKPPENWKEFNAVARFFTRKYNSESPTLYGTTLGGDYLAAVCEFLPRLWGHGGRTFDSDGGIALTSRQAIRALENYCNSFQYASPGSPNHYWQEQVKEFSQGETAMMILFTPQATEINDRHKSIVASKIGYSIIPGRNPVLGGWSLGINEKSRKKDLAFKFLRWASSKELAIPNTILGGSSPCVSLYKNFSLITAYPWLPKALESFSLSKKKTDSFPNTIILEKNYEEILGNAIHEAIIGNLSPEQALSLAGERLKMIIQGN